MDAPYTAEDLKYHPGLAVAYAVKKKRRGRPPKVNKALVDKAILYRDNWKHKDWVAIPTVEGLGLWLGIATATIYEHQDELANTLSWIKQTQAELLLSKGVRGEYNASIVKLILSAKHGYIERSQADITSAGKPVNYNPATAQSFTDYMKSITQAN